VANRRDTSTKISPQLSHRDSPKSHFCSHALGRILRITRSTNKKTLYYHSHIPSIDAIKELQRKAVGIKKTNDLPPAFTGVAQAFSVAEQMLSCIQASLNDKDKVGPDDQSNDPHFEAIETTLDSTRVQAESLFNILEKVLRDGPKPREERYKEIAAKLKTTVEKLMLSILEELVEVSQIPLPLIDQMTLKKLQDTAKQVQELEPSIKPPERAMLSFVNSRSGTQNAHGETGDIHHYPGSGPVFSGKINSIQYSVRRWHRLCPRNRLPGRVRRGW